MTKTSYFEGLIDKKTLSVMKVFIENPDTFFHINKVSSCSKVPVATSFRIINNLSKTNFLEKIIVGKFAIYCLSKSEKAMFFKKMLK
ncbi:MAG: hypothetical protein V1859_02070 [archaeon]